MRTLTNSEKRLLGLCLLAIFVVANLFVGRAIWQRLGGSDSTVEDLKQELASHQMWLGDKEYWEARREWLDKTMVPMDSAGKAQGELAQSLRDSLFDLDPNIEIERQTLVQPVSTPYYDEIAVSLRLEGDAAKINQWLINLQSPEKFVVIKALELELDNRSRAELPQAECNITIARWYKPKGDASYTLTEK